MSKDYSLSAINESVELGKSGHKLDGTNSGYLSIKDKDDNLLKIKGAAATSSDEFVTKSQLDAVSAKTGDYLAYSFDASSGISDLSGQGSGDSGAIRYGDKFKVGTAGTALGVSMDVGDVLVALVSGADVSDNTSSNTDWLHVEIKVASDFADGSTTDSSGGKIIVKDGGISLDKMAADSVNGSKIADNSIDSEHYVDGSIDTAHLSTGAVTNDKVSDSTLSQGKMDASLSAKINNGEEAHTTHVPNIASAIQSGLNFDTDSSITAQTNYATNTTVAGQLSQLDAELEKRAARKATVSYNGGAQNVGASISSGRVITNIRVYPTTIANGSNATMSIGISGDASKYVAVADINLYEGSVQVTQLNHLLSSSEQIVATVTQGTSTQGSFYVVVEHC